MVVQLSAQTSAEEGGPAVFSGVVAARKVTWVAGNAPSCQ